MEKLVKLNRTAKVVKGGRSFSFSALTVVGDRQGMVGFGFGKAKDVTEAIRKSIERARRVLVKLPVKNGTIPHEVIGEYKATHVLLKPACPGSGIIAGGPVRAIMEAGGVTDVLSKCVGSRSSINIVRAVFNGVDNMMDAKTVAKNRGKTLKTVGMSTKAKKIEIDLVKSCIHKKPEKRATVRSSGAEEERLEDRARGVLAHPRDGEGRRAPRRSQGDR